MKGCRRESFFASSGRTAEANVTSTDTIIRTLGRNRLSVALSLLIVLVVGLVLYHLLRDVDIDEVVAALRAQSRRNILTAGVFVIAGYITLTFYDYFALRIIGHGAVPFAVAAIASFTSYTIGHTLGAATLTGGLVRLRVYSVWGLNVIDVAKMAFVTGMTFWLGNAFVLGGALSYAPAAASAVDHLPVWASRGIGLAALFAMVAYVAWLAPRRRTVGYAHWKIVLPNVRFTLVQIAIGAADLTLVTLALYSLLPPVPPAAFVTVLVIFLTATLIGAVSHMPGNLGVIEAAMLIGLPHFNKEELLAALLTFRVLYFLIPLTFAMLTLGLRELGLIGRP
jgi:glycosyltransferase 2 family protein